MPRKARKERESILPVPEEVNVEKAEVKPVPETDIQTSTNNGSEPEKTETKGKSGDNEPKKKKRGKANPPKGYFDNESNTFEDPVLIRKFVVGNGILKAEDVAIMSDADVMSLFAKEYVVLKKENDVLIVRKEALASINNDIYLMY